MMILTESPNFFIFKLQTVKYNTGPTLNLVFNLVFGNPKPIFNIFCYFHLLDMISKSFAILSFAFSFQKVKLIILCFD